jgi:regulatory protein
VEEKLYSLAIPAKDHAEIISTLIEENCLDEERFAMAYAGGKFRVKGWGRIKIKHALRQKKINEYTISRALDQIDKGEYELTLKKLAEEKYVFLKNDQYLIRKKKTIDYLMQKGYEPKLISTIVNALSQKKR